MPNRYMSKKDFTDSLTYKHEVVYNGKYHLTKKDFHELFIKSNDDYINPHPIWREYIYE